MMVMPNSEQIESVIANLRGIEAVKVVTSPAGIEEVHVIVNEERAPKQVVRDIESVLMARLNLEVDHKKISVAQVEGLVTPLVLPRLNFAEATMSVLGTRMEARVALDRDGQIYTCTRQGAYAPQSQIRLVAEATAGAIELAVGQIGMIAIEDIQSVQVAGRATIVCVIRLAGGRHDETFVGAVLSGHDPWRAAVNATLDALNRRLGLNP